MGNAETRVHRLESVTARRLAGRKLAAVAMAAIAALACLAMGGCSPGAEYPSMFPAVHDMPPPRPDATLDPSQVQKATEDLITERNHLSAEAQGANQAAAKQKPPKPPVAPIAGTAKGPADSTQTAGADNKP